MTTLFRFAWLILSSSLLIAPSHAQIPGLSFFDPGDVVICPAAIADGAPPDFSAAPCRQAKAKDIDPQGRLIWVRANVRLNRTTGPDGEPLSLYLSGKMSSEVYLNGVLIGRNGIAGADASSEIPGQMDAELFPPQNLFRNGDNEVVLRVSSFNGILHLKQPLHMIGIAPAGIYGSNALQSFGPSMVTLGIFLLGGLYFGVMAFITGARMDFLPISIICMFAAGQLVSETFRGLVQYPYPVHDYRLLAIAGFSTAFGLSVAFYIFRNFKVAHLFRAIAGLAILSMLAVLIIEGFDYKALSGMTLPLLASLCATGIWSYQRRPRAFLYFVALLIFMALVITFEALFLDTIFFLLVASFLILLFVDQALILAKEARERRSENARANRLEQVLAEVEERAETNVINIKSAGKMERITTSQIVRCQGAGGYSEIVLLGGHKVLHSVTLNELEKMLPATFLRIHRSHLVNVMHVTALTRDPAGTGTLQLAEGDDVPVSRRIMPKVREALA